MNRENTPSETTATAVARSEHTEAVASLYRPVLLPGATTFGDIFDDAKPWTYGEPHAWPAQTLNMDVTEGSIGLAAAKLYAFAAPNTRRLAEEIEAGNEIGPYCSVKARGGRWALDVHAAPNTIAAVAPRIVTPADHLSFEIIEHAKAGWALVILQHGYILGSHWLAYIDPATIPAHSEQAAS